MSHASTNKSSKNILQQDGTTGKRQSRRRDLMDALLNFKKEQDHHHHKRNQQQKSSSSGASSVTGLGSKTGSIASSSTNTTATRHSDNHRTMTIMNEKKQLENKLSQRFQQLASDSIEKENMMQDSNAFFDKNKSRRSTVSVTKTRQRPVTPSIPTNQQGTGNHSRTKSLLMHSTNFLRSANTTSLPINSESVESHQTSSIPSDYSEPRSFSQSSSSNLGVPTANKHESDELDMHSALTYPDKGRTSTSDESRFRQASLYKPTSARKRSYTLADVNAGSKSPSFDENMVKENFEEPEVQHEILAIPTGWTAEQETGRLSDEFLFNSVSHEGEEEEEVEGIECLTADLLLPSSMASRHTYSSTCRSSAARRYASLFKNNRSEESLVSISRQDSSNSEDHNYGSFDQSSDRIISKRESIKPENVTPLPPRRQARRARVQSTCVDARKETKVATMNAVKNADKITRPIMTDRRPTYHPSTTAEVKQIQRRISESSLNSARTFFPLHDVSTDSQLTRTNLKGPNMEDTNALGIQSLAHKVKHLYIPLHPIINVKTVFLQLFLLYLLINIYFLLVMKMK
ncbi:hypothetical protein L7F22_042174 [Adiantum nelumboides]|nr:hypothetical protein [Adiantum nelumboides]